MRAIVLACALLCGALFAESLVAAGAGYKKPLEEVASAFEAQSGKKISRIYGNLAQVIEQAKQSGKIDAIVGDEKFIANSKLQTHAPQLIGYGKLVVVGKKGGDFKGIEDLEKMERIAIPDDKKAIYGVAGMEFLQNAKLFEKLESKLMFVATVPQVSTYLINGNVDAGFINISDYLALKDDLGAMVEISQYLYKPILISIAKLADSNNSEIDEFMKFLTTNEAKEIFAKYGL